MLFIGFIVDDIKNELVSVVHKTFSAAGLKPSIVVLNQIEYRGEQTIKQYLAELQKCEVDVVIFLIEFKRMLCKLPNDIQLDIIVSIGNLKNEAISLQQTEFIKQTYRRIRKQGVLIINGDDEDLPELIRGLITHIVTYGFNPRATITASSVDDSMNGAHYIFCLQRTIWNIKGKKVEPHEFSVKLLKHSKKDVYNVLAIAGLGLVCGIDVNYIRNFLNEN